MSGKLNKNFTTMAKLSSYYTLCPLIDQQGLLDIEKDNEPGCVIVTLSRNIVIRYKLQDLKQISSWSSKERLTTKVIYDKSTRSYAAAFNEKRIRIWREEETDLNNVKGYKFQCPIHTILTCDDLSPIVVQQNGATASLEWAIKNRKRWTSKGIIKNMEKLLDCQLIHLNGQTSMYYLTKIEDTYNSVVVKLEDDTCLEKLDTIRRIELKRRSEELVGHTVIHNTNSAYLLTLWSHGGLYSHFLIGTSSNTESETLISVINNIDTKYPVVMVCLNEVTIAVYGADTAEEGAVLMIYNVQFKLMQAAQKLKLYTNDAKLWKIEDKLLLAANRNLAVAPYYLAPQRIAAMLGSSLRFKNQTDTDDIIIVQEAIVAQWDKQRMCIEKSPIISTPPNISKQISTYLKEGLSDAAIQETLIPHLLESNDIKSIYWCLDTFKDLPEKLLVDLLAFSLRSQDKMFIPLQNGTADDLIKINKTSKNNFLDKIFGISYSNVSLLPHLKNGLNFDEVLKLLEYLTDTLNNQTDSFDNNSLSDAQLYEWISILIDSHYQHYLLSQDSYVLNLFNQLKSVLEEHFQFLQDLENLRPMLDRIINGKSLRSTSTAHNKFYSIEEIKLY